MATSSTWIIPSPSRGEGMIHVEGGDTALSRFNIQTQYNSIRKALGDLQHVP
jgi:hypothetical protein